MTTSPRRAAVLLFAALALAIGCGGDEKTSPTQPTQADALATMAVLRSAFTQLDLTKLLVGGQVLPGARGTLTLTATAWTFDQYSPDGALEINGQLTLNVLSSPIPMKGTLQLSGSQQATVVVDLTIDMVINPESPTLGGSVTFNGVRFQVADLMAATAPADSTGG